MAGTSGTLAAETTNPIGLPWGEVVIAIIAFAVLLFVLGKVAWPQFEKAFAARTKAIEGGIADAEEAQREAKEALEAYRAQLSGAREEAAKIREDARVQAQAIRDDMLAQANAETERIAAAGRAQLEAQRAQIVADLRADLGRVSIDLASKVVGESLEDEARQRRTVERFLADLER
ncbi:F0F1 ATP synthase subunit B [Nakamurella sp. YIM 132087]|uniref:ATP synthase subunit b n=1 Tax=Nakamurella alba TaxID=2665158 RepID=A0A7K1FHR7_9ACTN|nr:F0F1 ATP synthase subunit B [Nakamurella alba]